MTMQVPARRPTRDLSQAATQGLGGLKHPMISRAGNRFTLVDVAGSQKPWQLLYIDVVIVDIGPNDSRMYFEGQYDPMNAGGNGEPPTCFSDNGTGPSVNSRKPQHPTCTGCPQSVWGSKVTQQGNEVPACQSGKKLAVIVDQDPSGLVYEFRVPPGSFGHKPTTDPQQGGWIWYCNALRGYNVQPCDVVTRISFLPNTMGVLAFKPVKMISGDPLEQRLHLAWDNPDQHREIVGDMDKAIDPATFAPRQIAPGPQGGQPQQFVPPQQQQIPPQPQPQQFAPPQQQQQPGTGALPFAPNAGAPAATTFAPPQQPGQAGLAPTASPIKRTRRTRAEIEAAKAAQQPQAGVVPQQQPQPQFVPHGAPQAVQPPPQQIGQQEVMPPQPGFVGGAQPQPEPEPGDIPGFLQRQPPANQNPNPAGEAPAFGMQQQPQGVDAAMALNLDQVFGVPTK